MSAAAVAASAAASSAALAASNSLRRSACEKSMPGFSDLTATVEQKRHYSDCVRMMHPEKDAVGFILAVMILVAFACFFGWLILDMLGSPISRWLTARKVR